MQFLLYNAVRVTSSIMVRIKLVKLRFVVQMLTFFGIINRMKSSRRYKATDVSDHTPKQQKTINYKNQYLELVTNDRLI